MIFEDDIELKLVINEQMRPIQLPKSSKRKVAPPRNKYEAEIEATYVINKPMRHSAEQLLLDDKNISKSIHVSGD